MNYKRIIEKPYTLEEIPQIVQQYLVPLCKRYSIFTLEGPLGAGKTTLIRSLLFHLGVQEVITSPTFTYVNTYEAHEKIIYHFDLYRLETVNDFVEMGFDEYLAAQNSYSFIEWPHIIDSLLEKKEYQKRSVKIILRYDENSLESRILELYVSV